MCFPTGRLETKTDSRVSPWQMIMCRRWATAYAVNSFCADDADDDDDDYYYHYHHHYHFHDCLFIITIYSLLLLL